MLRHTDFDVKGGERPFAALCIGVCCADEADLKIKKTAAAYII
jgi:hypothetical protein